MECSGDYRRRNGEGGGSGGVEFNRKVAVVVVVEDGEDGHLRLICYSGGVCRRRGKVVMSAANPGVGYYSAGEAGQWLPEEAMAVAAIYGGG